ncbi:Two-component transcriptional response regulator, OmpR family [uncultured Gammaproteobacteria bacterium]|uniref:response regulator n=1 Tax=Bathymodiolus heckerae thiotrophic gill symbiont TaxID=1052212 RepID=UPI0010B5FC9E|nr:response regulator [Bathymodiolus heckerae thiotrophic gill symbiont]CAC9582347.1 Two-component transcriptional response regulator, OmpR family [uncultured Gammaproteobacteria bacterium]CAC9595833.1 Two-component transcriptional response regulator, OmpR family [uncultured Gammaproteobacteria bacterium]CAC9607476.1 Two-component transcriptional response regulator, OmpR family [uncultured Gammaproteobacteria bacterium]CAC9956347.1 Two-component transcriptional response regulator, OmpR family [
MKNNKLKLLVVDDDSEIRHLLKQYLQKTEFQVSVVADGQEMFSILREESFDLIILDLMLPGEDGLSLLRRLRADSNTPVIMLTAMGEETDRILGLEMGADDYISKPFNPRELLARIKSVLRRASMSDDTSSNAKTIRAEFSNWVLNFQQRHLTSPEGVVIPLSDGEFQLLKVFIDNSGRTLSREQLLNLTQGRESDSFDRSIDVLVGCIRKRLDETPKNLKILHAVRSEGYLFSPLVKFY